MNNSKFWKSISFIGVTPLLALSSHLFAASDMKVINNTSIPIQAIWQAGGCLDVVQDWEDDTQYTVCEDSEIDPQNASSWTFGSFDFDRSVKVFTAKHGLVAYCNSMDDQTIRINDAGEKGSGDISVETSC